MEKQCFKCGTVKPLTDFYKHGMMTDGHLGKCKQCTKRDTADRVAVKMQDPEWANKEAERHRIKSRKSRIDGTATILTKEQRREVTARYREKHPSKTIAHNAVAKALRSGTLIKLPCEKCGEEAEAHHDDYSKPLEVRWLCVKHHAEHHVKDRELKSYGQ